MIVSAGADRRRLHYLLSIWLVFAVWDAERQCQLVRVSYLLKCSVARVATDVLSVLWCVPNEIWLMSEP
jgi:hypothetical protein